MCSAWARSTDIRLIASPSSNVAHASLPGRVVLMDPSRMPAENPLYRLGRLPDTSQNPRCPNSLQRRRHERTGHSRWMRWRGATRRCTFMTHAAGTLIRANSQCCVLSRGYCADLTLGAVANAGFKSAERLLAGVDMGALQEAADQARTKEDDDFATLIEEKRAAGRLAKGAKFLVAKFALQSDPRFKAVKKRAEELYKSILAREKKATDDGGEPSWDGVSSGAACRQNAGLMSGPTARHHSMPPPAFPPPTEQQYMQRLPGGGMQGGPPPQYGYMTPQMQQQLTAQCGAPAAYGYRQAPQEPLYADRDICVPAPAAPPFIPMVQMPLSHTLPAPAPPPLSGPPQPPPLNPTPAGDQDGDERLVSLKRTRADDEEDDLVGDTGRRRRGGQAQDASHS